MKLFKDICNNNAVNIRIVKKYFLDLTIFRNYNYKLGEKNTRHWCWYHNNVEGHYKYNYNYAVEGPTKKVQIGFFEDASRKRNSLSYDNRLILVEKVLNNQTLFSKRPLLMKDGKSNQEKNYETAYT